MLERGLGGAVWLRADMIFGNDRVNEQLVHSDAERS